MTRKAKKKESPTVIAVRHYDWGELINRESIKSVARLFKKAKQGEKRTLFIEIHEEAISDLLTKEVKPHLRDAFYVAVKLADKYGWKIVALDKKSITSKLQWQENPVLTENELRERNFDTFNLRENMWTDILKDFRAGRKDFVVMHPNHVRGFLIESGIKGKNVVWIDKPAAKTFRGQVFGKRLNARERRQLKRRKEWEARIRKRPR
jgi:hypothetical protein